MIIIINWRIKYDEKAIFLYIHPFTRFRCISFRLSKRPETGRIRENEEKTRVVKTINGNVTVPANPKRVVTIGYAGTMLAFGIKPLGETGKYLGSPYIKDQVSGIKDIGGKDGFSVSVEKVLELKPDLIVSMTNDSKEYEKLSKIAPTVVYPFGTFKDARDEMKTFGKPLRQGKGSSGVDENV